MTATDADAEEQGLVDREPSPPAFGHPMLRYFGFDPAYVNLNIGSYGSMPLPVSVACEAMSRKVESNPDRFTRFELAECLRAVRARLAKLIGARMDEIVMIPNSSHGLSTILLNFEWHMGDVIICTNATHKGLRKSIQYLHDRPPHPLISEINLVMPTTHTALVDLFRSHIRSLRNLQESFCKNNYDGPKLKIVAIIDSIVSNPAALMPWKELTQLCHEEGVWSIIDAAHSIGQELDINLDAVKPDFWVSSCHKWLFAKRGCSVLYVPKRNQHIMKSAFPTHASYVSPGVSGGSSFIDQFTRPSTRDFIPYLSINAALDFREWLGGEARINAYCQSLAVAGGKHLAKVLGTQLLDQRGELTLNMVNVELPLFNAVVDDNEVKTFLERSLLLEWNTYGACFRHNGKWWIRCCAQIWNEVSDFEYLGNAVRTLCRELEEKFEK